MKAHYKTHFENENMSIPFNKLLTLLLRVQQYCSQGLPISRLLQSRSVFSSYIEVVKSFCYHPSHHGRNFRKMSKNVCFWGNRPYAFWIIPHRNGHCATTTTNNPPKASIRAFSKAFISMFATFDDLTMRCTYSPSQSAPNILVLKTRDSL